MAFLISNIITKFTVQEWWAEKNQFCVAVNLKASCLDSIFPIIRFNFETKFIRQLF